MILALASRVTQHFGVIMRYRRASVPGASYFFTLITQQRLFMDQARNSRRGERTS